MINIDLKVDELCELIIYR